MDGFEIVGCSPRIPPGVCEACDGDGLLDEQRSDGSLHAVTCDRCDGSGGG